MIKRAPIRNQRSKGIKVKHVLQICLLLAVCFWLIYQVKHSHNKKKEFDDRNTKVSVKTLSGDETLTLGRKDLPQVRDVAKNEKHEEEEEDVVEDGKHKPEEDEKEVRKHEDEEDEEANRNEEVDHEDEEKEANMQEQVLKEAGIKHEEEEQEEETKNEETEEEKRGSGNEEMDELDQEKREDEADREEEFIDEEKEREGDDDARESKVNEVEERESQEENEHSSDDNDLDVGDTNIHVAREEHYKADDASSAVSHDNQVSISETEKTSSENSNEKSERDISEDKKIPENTEEVNGNQKSTGLKLGEAEMDESGSTLNITTAEEKDHGTRSYNPKDSSLIKATNISTEAEIANNSAGLSIEINDSRWNGNETKLDSSQAQNATLIGASNLEATNQQTELKQANNNNTIFYGNKYDSHSTISIKTVSADVATGVSFNNSEPILSEKKMSLNATPDGGVSSGSSTNENANSTQNETMNSNYESGGTNEISDSSSTEGTVDGKSGNESGESTESLDSSPKNEIVDAAKEDFIDSSDSSVVQDDKESQIGLDTLPDIRNTADDSKDAAAE